MKTKIAVHWQYGAATHTGWYRTLNEDRSLLRIGSTKQGKPYAAAVLADGMGGTEDGGGASELAVNAVKMWLEERAAVLLDEENYWNAVEKELRQLYRRIHEALTASPYRQGTTLSVLLLTDHSYLVAHIGDCRILRLGADGGWSLLTKDHTWVQRQVTLLRMTEREAMCHPKRHILLRSLGLKREPAVDFRTGVYHPRTVFVLISDGFHDRITTGALAGFIRKELADGSDLQQISEGLVERALMKRADDNVSLLLLRPLGGSAPLRKLYRLYAAHACRRLKKLQTLIPVFRQR
ncbi:serine/threonine-protein phosphatase [Paenibacillus filicis]|uniref:Serine/threonine-protein phosphatase n=1 Tax=Paenibacillus gyeongsangnamensis TaxID=3388067 RepID=A0ABT4QGA6_9BACL|nr:PP2C family serine/threonine-protein phosphatase [Paenibacillus filicis]MCZ8515879.1 serine/threonine-protein phosphatase [Paenibacillus filicis]